MIKAKKIKIKDDTVIAVKSWGCVKLKKSEIRSISLRKVSSLVDEIGLTISGKSDVFITDGITGFNELALWFDFAAILGNDWYMRADSGEQLHHNFM